MKTVPVYFDRAGKFPFRLNTGNNAIISMVNRKIYVKDSRVKFIADRSLNTVRRHFKHELQHVKQFDNLGGINFFAKYKLLYFKGLIKYGTLIDAYKKHPMEIDAEEAEYQPWTDQDKTYFNNDILSYLEFTSKSSKK